MTALALYLVTFVVFLAIDFLGLSYLIKPIFTKQIGHLMTARPRLAPAFFFYAFFIGGVVYFAAWPALVSDESLYLTFLHAAFLGAMAYGTYEFTNLAIMKDWTWSMVLPDLVWGTVLTGTAAAVGVSAMRLLS